MIYIVTSELDRLKNGQSIGHLSIIECVTTAKYKAKQIFNRCVDKLINRQTDGFMSDKTNDCWILDHVDGLLVEDDNEGDLTEFNADIWLEAYPNGWDRLIAK